MIRYLREAFSPIEDAVVASRLIRPAGGVRDVVLDTDTYNEIDDQYALAYLVRSTQECRIQAITAAPFWSDPIWKRPVRSSDPADGMHKSYDEILRVLRIMDREDLDCRGLPGKRNLPP